MGLFCLDSSAVFKRYRRESGTEVVDRILNGPRADDRFYTSFLGILEVTPVVLRLSKGGQLAATIGNQVLADFRQDLGRLFDVWPLDQAVTAAAVRTIERHTLKLPDAIHLTTALALNRANPNASCILSAISVPPPKASPFTAAMIGLSKANIGLARSKQEPTRYFRPHHPIRQRKQTTKTLDRWTTSLA